MLAAHNYATNNSMARLDLSTAKNNLEAQALYIYRSAGYATMCFIRTTKKF